MLCQLDPIDESVELIIGSKITSGRAGFTCALGSLDLQAFATLINQSKSGGWFTCIWPLPNGADAHIQVVLFGAFPHDLQTLIRRRSHDSLVFYELVYA
ncbi:hypothetical protein [Corynebacterium meridianum]|uniref:hypothetical protein n=1 Tax=Corynebacterium meridianum TaxID=2765363 RepID=UPI001E3E8991|nr:hypothetical protein [Corynebacterium meridianum]